jgi:hypothetical protein
LAQPAKRGSLGGEVSLVLAPRPLPAPVFRYRLLPTAPELNAGDAAPIYLRLVYEQPDRALREASDKAAAWLLLPLSEFPAAEARKLADRWSVELTQIEYGARRKNCDWNYTLPEERDHQLTIRLPDTQTMPIWGRILAVRARAEIAEGKPEDAIRTIATGLAFSRHVSQGGPFYINNLVGIAIAAHMLADLDELNSQPEAPNLYWALTALPRPLISTRDAMENEWMLAERMVPELVQADQTRSDADWSALLVRMHARMARLSRLLGFKPEDAWGVVPESLDAFKTAMLPKARDYLKEHHLEATSDDHAIVLAMVTGYQELYHEFFKHAYLPYPQGVPVGRVTEERVVASKKGPAALFGSILPAVHSVQMSEVMLDRKVAALRVVAALRLYAAAHKGQLPESLDEVKDVPIPIDPMTGKPFEYRREADGAVLIGVNSAKAFRLLYRMTVRK